MAAVSMDEVRAQFQQEKGKSWDEATSDEKRIYVRSMIDERQKNLDLQHNKVQIKSKKKSAEQQIKAQGGKVIYAPIGASKPVVTDMSMDAIHAQFQQETGKSWEEATSEEKRFYVRSGIDARRKKLDLQYSRVRTKPKKKSAAQQVKIQNISTPFHIQRLFFAQTGVDWNQADQKLKDRFLKEYNKQQTREIRQKKKEAQRRKKAAQQVKRQKDRAARDQAKAQRRREKEAVLKARETAKRNRNFSKQFQRMMR